MSPDFIIIHSAKKIKVKVLCHYQMFHESYEDPLNILFIPSLYFELVAP